MSEARKIADKIVEFLDEFHLAGDTCIYFDGMCYQHATGRDYWETTDNIYPSDYFDYADGIVCMSFEGDFYSVMNNLSWVNMEQEKMFRLLLEDLGCYYELGNSWNLAIHKIEREER